jgi:hypothetical protein
MLDFDAIYTFPNSNNLKPMEVNNTPTGDTAPLLMSLPAAAVVKPVKQDTKMEAT